MAGPVTRPDPDATTKHIVLFPFPGQGHLSAFMSLAGLLRRALPDAAAAITLVSTPRNVAALRTAAASSSLALGFHALPFAPADHGLPPGCESSDALPPSRVMDLLEAFEALQPAFDAYLAATVAAGGGHVCVVSDAFTAWTVAAARRRGCAHALFVSCGAYGSAVVHSLWSHLPVRPDPATGRVHLPEYPDLVIHRSQLSKNALRRDPAAAGAGARDPAAAFYGRQIPFGYETDAVVINTVEGLEPTGLAMLRRTLRVPVWPIGPLVRAASPTVVAPRTDEAAVVGFLDAHAPSSVLYISFGSQNSIRAEHMRELAVALESTGRPFVWAIRPPDGHDINGEFRAAEWLPAGFEELTGTRGLLVRGWAPQVRILAHPATGAFLSHCGWNSVLESVAHGVPILGWPLAGEQFYNAKMLDEEWGVCVEVARGNAEGNHVDRDAVADVVEMVMGETAKAGEMRRQMRKIREVMEAAWTEEDGSSRKALEQFLRAMKVG